MQPDPGASKFFIDMYGFAVHLPLPERDEQGPTP